MTGAKPSHAAVLDAWFASREVEIEHHSIERPWGCQHVVTAGPVDGPVVALVHGWPEHWFAWREVMVALADTARVVAVDVRGFGWSSSTVPDAHFAGFVDDLVAVLDHLGIDEPVVLAGHDWGGWTSFAAALEHPARFRSLLVVANMPPWLDRGVMIRSVGHWAYIFLMAVAGRVIARSSRAVAALMRASSTVRWWEEPGGALALRSYGERVSAPVAATMTRRLYATFVTSELPAALGPRPGKLEMPATVLLGEHEGIVHRGMFEGRCLPGEITVAQALGAGHWVLDEAPAVVVEHLRSALGEAALGEAAPGEAALGNTSRGETAAGLS